MPSLDQFASNKLAALERHSLRRALVPTERTEGIWAERNGRKLLSFSCNDYLGMAQHPALKAAAVAAIERHGVGAGASRLVTGNHPLYAELEARLARFKVTESACVFGSGYLANTGVAQALVVVGHRGGRGQARAGQGLEQALVDGGQADRILEAEHGGGRWRGA